MERAFAVELMASESAGLGYLLEERVGRAEEFLDALRRVSAGVTAIDPEVVAQLLSWTPASAQLERLSSRARDVLALMADGHGNKAIAEQLVMSDGAVHKHIRNVFAKFDLPPDDSADRCVTVVLRYLQGAQQNMLAGSGQRIWPRRGRRQFRCRVCRR